MAEWIVFLILSSLACILFLLHDVHTKLKDIAKQFEKLKKQFEHIE